MKAFIPAVYLVELGPMASVLVDASKGYLAWISGAAHIKNASVDVSPSKIRDGLELEVVYNAKGWTG